MTHPRPFTITTPIYYINAKPHLGHAYTTIACDAIARYQRMRGRDVLFLTGTDEHGQKVADAAEAAGQEPQRWADGIAAEFREAWKKLDCSFDDFIRTTEDRHVAGAQELWRRLAAAGDLYKDSYEGPYCKGCEAYYTEGQLVDGRCPEADHHAVETLSEESWFFRLSKYQDRLLDLYESNPGFVTPRTRLNEVRSFVAGGLNDLSVSRRRLKWGVPVPGDPDHVMYVWIDALSNYVSALGFGPGADPESFSDHWPCDLHVLAKDIIRFHAVYWPAFLMSAGLPLPRAELVHGYWLRDEQKMSKTKGNVADPNKLLQWFPADAIRWFLLREISLGADGNYSEEALVDRVNADLANDLGNTLSRVSKIVVKNLDGAVPAARKGGPLFAAGESAWRTHAEAMERHDLQGGLKAASGLLAETNRFLVAEEPWKLAKDDSQRGRLEEVMHEAAEALRHVAVMVAPAMPSTAREIWRRLGLEGDPFAGLLTSDGEPLGVDSGSAGSGTQREILWGFPEHGPVLDEGPLFPRIDKAAFFADAGIDIQVEGTGDQKHAKDAKRAKKKTPPASSKDDAAEEGSAMIEFDDFMKVQLRAARVISCKAHPDPKVDRLLVLELDDGSGEPRTICAGVAQHHRPEDLEGRTIAIVANLTPRKLRGVESQGMLLAANWNAGDTERVSVILLPDDVPPGAEIR